MLDLETRDGASHLRETYSLVERSGNLGAQYALHHRVLSALLLMISFSCERPASGHRLQTCADMVARSTPDLMRAEHVMTTFVARVQILLTGCSACVVVQEM